MHTKLPHIHHEDLASSDGRNVPPAEVSSSSRKTPRSSSGFGNRGSGGIAKSKHKELFSDHL